jgi:multiple sugar transport system permease protein
MGALRGGPVTAAASFTAGTAAVWLGCALGLRAAWLIFRLLAKQPGSDPQSLLRGVVVSAFPGGLLLSVGSVLVRSVTQADGYWRLPLVWWVMPFSAWLQVAGVIGALISLLQWHSALTKPSRTAKLINITLWLAAGGIGSVLYHCEPENSISVLKGFLPLQPATAITLLLLAIAATAAMAFAAQTASSRKLGKTIVSHLSLIAGAVIFGTPLLFLLVTSFKEDRDMSSPNGIVWVPRVQQTMPYFDKKNPLYEANYQGQTVQATVTSVEPDGTVKLDVAKPPSLRGIEVETRLSALREVPRDQPLYSLTVDGVKATGLDIEDREDGSIRIEVLEPPNLKGRTGIYQPSQLEPVRDVGLRWQNYSEALSYLPPGTASGLVFLKNTLIIAILSCIGTILSSSLAAYAFARMRFPGREALFAVFLATMMLPSAVTMLPQFLIYRSLGWIDTLLPLWAPAFFGSALNIFMLRQFFRTIPMELEDAAKIDGCSYGRTFWSVMLPQIKPALAVIGITTFLAAWNNFFGPLIYINSPSKMPISYALQLYMGDRGNEPGLMMAFVTMTIIPILLLFFFAQRYFIEGVTLSGFGGK